MAVVKAATPEGREAPILEDCVVTAWAADRCTAPCGGGTRNLTRQVVTRETGGAACPEDVGASRASMKPSCSGPVRGRWTVGVKLRDLTCHASSSCFTNAAATAIPTTATATATCFIVAICS